MTVESATTFRRFLILAALLLLALPGPARAADEAEAEEPVKTIKMMAENWKWRPSTIRVTRGTRLIIEFKSYDASHSFVLKAFGIKVNLPEGKDGRVEFVADKAGEFKWRCGRPCGDGCAKMKGKLIVEEAETAQASES